MLLISLCFLFVVIFLLFLGDKQNPIEENKSELQGLLSSKKNIYMVAAFIAVLVLTSTVRYGFIDTYAYKIMYISSRNNLDYVNNSPWEVEKGWLYVLYFLNFISKNPKLMLFLSALIINLAFANSARKYSADIRFSLWIYFCLCFMDTNNGLRQFVAAAIIILAFPLLTKKKISSYLLYGLIVWLASQLHDSAMVCLVIAFVVVGKPLNKKVWVALAAGLFFFIFPKLVNGYMNDVFSDSKYIKYINMTGGMSFLRAFIVGVIPIVLAFMYLNKCKKNGVEIEYTEGILINLLIVNSMFVIMGLKMQYWARLDFYTIFAPIALLPKLVSSQFVSNEKKFVKYTAVVLYFIFFAYNIYVNKNYGAMRSFYIDLS